MKYLTLLLLLVSPLLAFAEKVQIHVPGMVCQMCVQGMQKQFKTAVKDPEKDVLVDLDTLLVTINTIKPISDKEIKERVNNAGYNAKAITRLDEKKEK